MGTQPRSIGLISAGQAERKPRQTGFFLDIERGYWTETRRMTRTPATDRSGNVKRVVPFVSDTKNALIMQFEPGRSEIEMASLQAAFKEAIQEQFQLEPRELASEPMPAVGDRKELLFYESSEGGAGVLRQLVEDPTVIGKLARRALGPLPLQPRHSRG